MKNFFLIGLLVAGFVLVTLPGEAQARRRCFQNSYRHSDYTPTYGYYAPRRIRYGYHNTQYYYGGYGHGGYGHGGYGHGGYGHSGYGGYGHGGYGSFSYGTGYHNNYYGHGW